MRKIIIDNITTTTIDSDTNTLTSNINRTLRIDDTIEVIDEYQNKSRLSIVHCARCTNQNKATNNIDN